MSNGEKGDTLSPCLSHLPATEHAILLNRFKFLNLVQRVAAADVAEMIQTIGLEALSYKGVLQKVQAPCAVSAAGGSAPVEIAARRGPLRGQRGGFRAATDASTEVPRRLRFPTRERELEFVQRMAQPHHDRDSLSLYLQKSTRGRQAGNRKHPTKSSSYLSHEGRGTEARGFMGGSNVRGTHHMGGSGGDDGDDNHHHGNLRRHDDDDDDDDSDVVVVDTSDELLQYEKARRQQQQQQQQRQRQQNRLYRPTSQVIPHLPLEHRAEKGMQLDASPEFASNAPEPFIARRRGRAPLVLKKTDVTAEGGETEPPRYRPVDASNNSPVEVTSPYTQYNSARGRGPFAPKAKPKAAAAVSRVPMEVIRHASALLANKSMAAQLPSPPPPPQGPLPAPPAAPQSGSWERQSTEFASGMSQSQPLAPPVLRFNKKGDSDPLHGQSLSGVMPSIWSSEALAELSSCVERMLQDHHAILDGIMKNEGDPSPDAPKIVRRVEKAGRGGVCDSVGGASNSIKKGPEREPMPLGTTAKLNSAHRLQRDYGVLGDFTDDEEDELLLISRLQRQIGAMDSELKLIEEREPCKGDVSEEVEDETVLRAAASAKRSGRRVVIDDGKRSPGGGGSRGRGHRRRGEMPRAIVERLQSFQKENHDSIRYEERQWNTSNVTEQVFAQRLTESLLEDAFQEVLEELGNILDTYVEGLVLHELQ